MSDLFSWHESKAEAERRRDHGMAVASNAQERESPGFSELAYAALVELAHRQPELHIDDFLQFFPLRPERPNAFGAVWLKAVRARVIVKSGRSKPCITDPGKHAHDYPVYLSLIYR